MTRVLSALGKAASFTFRGAAVTFGSTVFSCVVACQIEKGANRMIYTYFPNKFANVKAASGITQEELEMANMNYGAASIITQQQQDDNYVHNQEDHSSSSSSSSSSITTTTPKVDEPKLFFRYVQDEQQQEKESLSYFDDIRNQLLSLSTTTSTISTSTSTTQTKTTEKNTALEEENMNNKFWSEEANATANEAISGIIPTIIVPSQEIMACSLTA
ncbi:hypothetical protein FRACYDRAFT_270789 [Fragilariopsis cylindrus CCMP1102]|uniref:Uncharacterized protein n=1 Tax=Fragilariopsis cylindrus CCMP1102 TaxID=635003 RepID=A0A1E7F038_9STRA|nr:hypothetical protein FRACYDRAFT_270789 [Fragilariopsis cylindrus CCMP1102]|eukprot:OEU11487.1 hypothetical protein FRACYDRAFT_270789 [Fragilariopsis cylindrus CCMP1102]